MTTPKQPATEAGRAWYDRDRIHNVAQRTNADDRHDAALLADILAIEAEAAAGLLALREALQHVELRCARHESHVSGCLGCEFADSRAAPAAAEIEARIVEPWREWLILALDTLKLAQEGCAAVVWLGSDPARFKDKPKPATLSTALDNANDAYTAIERVKGEIEAALREQPDTEEGE